GILKATLDQFGDYSGLRANLLKFTLFLSGYSAEEQSSIRLSLGIQLGSFPMRYLGASLGSNRLSVTEFSPVISKITRRVQFWTAKCLSYADRLELIRSATIFAFPTTVIEKIQGILRNYLWSDKDTGRRSLVAWDDVCKSKIEDGLCMKELLSWNKASLAKSRNIWRESPKPDSSVYLKVILSIKDDLFKMDTKASILTSMQMSNERYATSVLGGCQLFGVLLISPMLALSLDWLHMIGSPHSPSSKVGALLKMMLVYYFGWDELFLSFMGFVTNVFARVMAWLNISTRATNLNQWLLLLGSCQKKDSFIFKATCAAFTNFVYYTWLERNRRLYEGLCSSLDDYVQQIINATKLYISIRRVRKCTTLVLGWLLCI
ncbi:hypothetical protein V2J09_014270, partial [Rumex salicifolius]